MENVIVWMLCGCCQKVVVRTRHCSDSQGVVVSGDCLLWSLECGVVVWGVASRYSTQERFSGVWLLGVIVDCGCRGVVVGVRLSG